MEIKKAIELCKQNMHNAMSAGDLGEVEFWKGQADNLEITEAVLIDSLAESLKKTKKQ